MPPVMGAAAFLMAEILQISYAEVAIAAIIPSVLYYAAVFIYADLEAARKNIAPMPPDTGSAARARAQGRLVLRHSDRRADLCAVLAQPHARKKARCGRPAAVVLVNWVFGYKGRRLHPLDLFLAFRDTGLAVVDVVIVGAMAGIIIGIIDVTGLGFGLTFILVQFGQQSLFGLLALTALVCIILGMGMPTTAIYLLVATLAAPPLIKLGINPLAAHMFVFYFGLVSLITPPVAIAAFVAANLAGAEPMETAVQAVRLGLDRAGGAGDVRDVAEPDHAGQAARHADRRGHGLRRRLDRHCRRARLLLPADGFRHACRLSRRRSLR